MLSDTKIVEIFCSVDDFVIEFLNHEQPGALGKEIKWRSKMAISAAIL